MDQSQIRQQVILMTHLLIAQLFNLEKGISLADGHLAQEKQFYRATELDVTGGGIVPVDCFSARSRAAPSGDSGRSAHQLRSSTPLPDRLRYT